PGPNISAGETPLGILPSEVRVAIESMKRSTAPGPDNITADFPRAGSCNLHVLFENHMAAYLKIEKIPNQWKTSCTVILPKKGDRNDLRNYRPICFLSALYKLFTKIILSRKSRTLDEAQPVEQAVFRKLFCCMVFHGLPLVLTFVDYEKAFDSVETNAILSVLVDQGADPSYIKTLLDCYRNCTTKIQFFRRPLTTPTGEGVRQGDTISQKLLSVALQWIMKSLDWDEKSMRIDGKFLSNFCFADDIVIFSRSTSEAEMMINELNEAGIKIEVRINRKKTQFMKSPWCEGEKIELDGS
ncbi:hypothetical protein Angca_002562, partial [Angiostrongylus cantonensis]